jgi:hypothetical protein
MVAAARECKTSADATAIRWQTATGGLLQGHTSGLREPQGGIALACRHRAGGRIHHQRVGSDANWAIRSGRHVNGLAQRARMGRRSHVNARCFGLNRHRPLMFLDQPELQVAGDSGR